MLGVAQRDDGGIRVWADGMPTPFPIQQIAQIVDRFGVPLLVAVDDGVARAEQTCST